MKFREHACFFMIVYFAISLIQTIISQQPLEIKDSNSEHILYDINISEMIGNVILGNRR